MKLYKISFEGVAISMPTTPPQIITSCPEVPPEGHPTPKPRPSTEAHPHPRPSTLPLHSSKSSSSAFLGSGDYEALLPATVSVEVSISPGHLTRARECHKSMVCASSARCASVVALHAMDVVIATGYTV